ncbi:MAG TPA: hypothetical protein VLV89_00150, partial [Candidatus Acidoferrum sp.]|nr:hypothetical protein [Candidatus Acidoferrum sp.]
MASWMWPEVDDLEGAEDAARKASYFAFAVAGLTALFALLAIGGVIVFPGMNAYGLIDAAIFGIAGWRMYLFSRAWAVVGLALYALET